MSTPPDPTTEQKLYDYAVVLLKSGDDMKSVRQSLMDFGADTELANQIVIRAAQRPSELVEKKKASRDSLIREAKQKAFTLVLAGMALGSLTVILTALPAKSPLLLWISYLPAFIGGFLSTLGLYRWYSATSKTYDDDNE